MVMIVVLVLMEVAGYGEESCDCGTCGGVAVDVGGPRSDGGHGGDCGTDRGGGDSVLVVFLVFWWYWC